MIMTKDIWFNLPVKDVARSRDFFTKLGFTFNDKHGIDPACMLVGEKKVVVMLFSEEMMKGFLRQEVTDTKTSNEMLISIDAESRAEVDELAQKAKDAGATYLPHPAKVRAGSMAAVFQTSTVIVGMCFLWIWRKFPKALRPFPFSFNYKIKCTPK
jgi:uncharacterized protein